MHILGTSCQNQSLVVVVVRKNTLKISPCRLKYNLFLKKPYLYIRLSITLKCNQLQNI